jgi:thioredoxin-dependent peroxiredoxin
MASVTFRGKLMQTVAALPIIGSHAPDFTLTNTELIERSLKDFHGQKVVLNIFISVDTPTCARATVHFNKLANQLKNLIVLSISADLPFAQKRFCAAEGLNKGLLLHLNH